ncbi:TPA: hypothetical protein ACLBGF_001553, partial [Neisseria meningitidis]
KTAENLCLGFGCREGKEFCKGLSLCLSRMGRAGCGVCSFCLRMQMPSERASDGMVEKVVC